MKHASAYAHLITMSIVIIYTLLSSAMVLFKIDNASVRVVAIVVFVSCAYLAINRNTYLPFLGETAISPIVFEQELAPAGSSMAHTLNLDEADGTRVLYWASMPKKDQEDAYQGFANTGITSVKNGKASLKINCPDTYDVGMFFRRTLGKHIHYRLIRKDNPMMSQVHTVYISC